MLRGGVSNSVCADDVVAPWAVELVAAEVTARILSMLVNSQYIFSLYSSACSNFPDELIF